MNSLNNSRNKVLTPRASDLKASFASSTSASRRDYNFQQEKLIDLSLEQSIIEWISGVFEITVPSFKAFYDGEIQL